jgi:hypothetical protein
VIPGKCSNDTSDYHLVLHDIFLGFLDPDKDLSLRSSKKSTLSIGVLTHRGSYCLLGVKNCNREDAFVQSTDI